MTQTNTLLIELGTEELPPKSLKALSDAFVKNIETEITKAGFSFSAISAFAAPRRLAVSLSDCLAVQADSKVEKKGPAVSAAFDADGNATRAAQGWAKSNGITVEQAQRLKTDKGEWLLHVAEVKGKALKDELQNVLSNTLKRLPIPKPMRWGSSNAEFIRPVHTLCVLFGDQIIDTEAFGLRSSNLVSGHRFHGQHRVELTHADDYASTLKEQFVLADYPSRMAKIEAGLNSKAAELGLRADYSQDLLEEISSLVEWPVVLTAEFENTFLDVPKEALIYTMKDDQKYVPLLDDNGELSSRFLFVSNIESKDPAQVIHGNEKVIRPRLADAQFFFETDKKTTLESKAQQLSSVLFQKELGTVAEKAERLADISIFIASKLNANEAFAKRAASLAKADLMSNMVMEFPSVQGVMGKHYALHDGEPSEVALAIEEQYLPRFSGDKLPSTSTGTIVAIAEKLDTLIGIFGIGKLPKGDKDPFALRRSAIGLLRILIENKIAISLTSLVSKMVEIYGSKITNKDTQEQVIVFLNDRFKPLFLEQGIKPDVIASVMATQNDYAFDVSARVEAVNAFKALPEASSLAAANKRVSNILNKNRDALPTDTTIDESLFVEAEERSLYEALSSVRARFNTSVDESDYVSALSSLTVFEKPLAAFFESIMIMAEDEKLKNNRLALIKAIRELISQVADISELSV